MEYIGKYIYGGEKAPNITGSPQPHFAFHIRTTGFIMLKTTAQTEDERGEKHKNQGLHLRVDSSF